MEDNKLVKVAAVAFIGLVVAPIVINGAISIGCAAYNKVSKIKFNRKIKKGKENGTIVEIDGQYYEMQDVKGE
jgi:hypothetical protein